MKRSTRQILSRGLPAALLALPLLMFSSPAYAVELYTDTDAQAEAIQERLKGNYDYNSLMAVKLTHIAVEEKGQHDLPAARQFMRLAEEYAAKAGGAK